MPITPINPEGPPTVDLYRQVSVATGSKLVFIAAQVEQCYLNVGRALAAAGATLAEPDMLIEVEATAVID